MTMRRAFVVAAALCAAVVVTGCEEPAAKKPKPAPAKVPDIACPGGPTCSETLADDDLLAGAAAVDITPTRFEIARATYLLTDSVDDCPVEAPVQATGRRCGALKENIYDDCGHDGVCFGDEGYVAPDEDGSEQDDNDDDWFFDCGVDRICPNNVPEEGELATNGFDDDGDGAIDDAAYPGPDDGEGDGVFQGLWIAGYDNSRPALGIHDRLYATAVVFQQGDTTLGVVTIDALGLFYDEQLRIRELVEAERPGAIDLVIMQATHTHEGPDTLGQWGQTDPFTGLQFGSGRDETFMQGIREGAAAAIVQAYDALIPVTVKVGARDLGIASWVHDSRNPQIYNAVLTAIAVDDKETGTPVATIVAWGNHPENLDSENNFISPDYVGAVRHAIQDGVPATATHEARAPRPGVAVYWQGAVGGLMSPNHFSFTGRDGTAYESSPKTFARCRAYGENLADVAIDILDNDAEDLATPPLRFSSLAYRAVVENQIFHVGLFNGWFDRVLYDFDQTKVIEEGNYPVLETAVTVGYVGGIGFACAPGELFPESFVGFNEANAYGEPLVDADNPNPPDLSSAPPGPYLRDLLDTTYPVALGLCNDEIGYLVPPYDFKLNEQTPYIDEADGDHYEETNSLGPSSVPLMLQAFDVLFSFEKARSN